MSRPEPTYKRTIRQQLAAEAVAPLAERQGSPLLATNRVEDGLHSATWTWAASNTANGGWNRTSAHGINDAGFIVGQGRCKQKQHGSRRTQQLRNLKTPRQIELANAFCRYLEMAQGEPVPITLRISRSQVVQPQELNLAESSVLKSEVCGTLAVAAR